MLFILVDVLVAEVNIEHTSAGFFQLAIQRRQQFRFESRLHQRVVLVLHVQNQKIVLKIPKKTNVLNSHRQFINTKLKKLVLAPKNLKVLRLTNRWR